MGFSRETMQSYPDGTQFLVGDHVLIEHGRTPATIEFIIMSDDEISEWGVSEPGLMLLSDPFGRVFWPCETMEQDPPRFVSRVREA
jgi:hypothetical protein